MDKRGYDQRAELGSLCRNRPLAPRTTDSGILPRQMFALDVWAQVLQPLQRISGGASFSFTQPAGGDSSAVAAPPLQLPIALGLNLLLLPAEHVPRRDVADRAVQTDVVVMLYVTLNQTPRIFQRQRRARPDALPFECFVPTLDFAVRLRIIRRSPG